MLSSLGAIDTFGTTLLDLCVLAASNILDQTEPDETDEKKNENALQENLENDSRLSAYLVDCDKRASLKTGLQAVYAVWDHTLICAPDLTVSK